MKRARRKRLPQNKLMRLAALNVVITKLAAQCVEEQIESGDCGTWFLIVERNMNALAKHMSRNKFIATHLK